MGGLLVLLIELGFTVSLCIFPFSPSRTLFQLVVIIPFFISTLKMLALLRDMMPGSAPDGPMKVSQPAELVQGSDENYKNITDDVSTVYNL
ncbi:hypothetical protein ATANTOWER_021164 [Ataeniobius toweri]|uniref:Uncharacterized protein n=1 Tax=Ataeniobius toweri TaxID=208326 RepID=A0ABU7BRR5_9TELE|nr:hypothetical protein [Ataeniobius toweri]